MRRADSTSWLRADAPITYNPMDNLDPVTGLPLDGGKKKKKQQLMLQQQQQQQGAQSSAKVPPRASNGNDASAVAREYLERMYGSALGQD